MKNKLKKTRLGKAVLEVVKTILFPIRFALLKQKAKTEIPYFDPEFKRNFESMTPEMIKAKYETVWEAIEDDCVKGDDLSHILSHIHPEVKSVLEIGCGLGRVSIELAKTGRLVVGVDMSDKAIELAKKNAGDVSVTFLQSFVETLPFPDKSFDCIVTCHTLEHVVHLDAAIKEILRVAKKQVIVIVPMEEKMQLLSTDYHIQFFPNKEALVSHFPFQNFIVFEDWVENDQWHGSYIFYSAIID